jgi:hypothetical protein
MTFFLFSSALLYWTSDCPFFYLFFWSAFFEAPWKNTPPKFRMQSAPGSIFVIIIFQILIYKTILKLKAQESIFDLDKDWDLEGLGAFHRHNPDIRITPEFRTESWIKKKQYFPVEKREKQFKQIPTFFLLRFQTSFQYGCHIWERYYSVLFVSNPKFKIIPFSAIHTQFVQTTYIFSQTKCNLVIQIAFLIRQKCWSHVAINRSWSS